MSDKKKFSAQFLFAVSEITMTSFIINKDLEPSAILGPPFINQLIRGISILLKTRVNRKNRDGRIDLRIFKFWNFVVSCCESAGTMYPILASNCLCYGLEGVAR